MIPFTMTRNGDFSYDMSCLDGIQLYYSIYGKWLEPTNTIGTITLEEAIDPDYLDTVKAYMEGFMADHEEVGRMCLWEQVLLKHHPRLGRLQRMAHHRIIRLAPNARRLPHGFR